MASDSRHTPSTNVTRRLAINAADSKNNAMDLLSLLSNATKGRLVEIHTNYNAAYIDVALKKNALAMSTVQKNVYIALSRMMNSHFVQVFNLGVERNKYPAAARSFYMIDISSASIPDMITEATLLQVGSDLVTGDAARVAAGGAAMANPSIAEVTSAYDDYKEITMPHSALKEAYDSAQETLDGLNAEADKVIKKVWDEVETFYNEEPPASQRENAREWGVIYVLVGSNKKVTGKVLDSVTGLPIEGVKVSFENGNRTVISGPDGSYELGTTLMGDQAITAEGELHNDYREEVELVENEDKVWDILMVPAV